MMNDSHLVPRLDEEGNHVRDEMGKLAYDEAYGLGYTPPAAPTEGGRKSRRPGEEADLPDEKVVAAERQKLKAQGAELDTREKNLADREASLKSREEQIAKTLADAKKR